jgi:hypothetical protein
MDSQSLATTTARASVGKTILWLVAVERREYLLSISTCQSF